MTSNEEIKFENVESVCPVCNSENTKVTQKIMDIPHFPQMWFFNLTCGDCHFVHNDFLNLSVKEPTRYTYHAENEDDYTSKIVRASNGTIRFPQLGAMIEPGPNADGFISNIEGILRDIQSKAKFLLNDAETADILYFSAVSKDHDFEHGLFVASTRTSDLCICFCIKELFSADEIYWTFTLGLSSGKALEYASA